MQQPKLCRAKVLSNQPCNRGPAAAVIRHLLARVRQVLFSRRQSSSPFFRRAREKIKRMQPASGAAHAALPMRVHARRISLQLH